MVISCGPWQVSRRGVRLRHQGSDAPLAWCTWGPVGSLGPTLRPEKFFKNFFNNFFFKVWPQSRVQTSKIQFRSILDIQVMSRMAVTKGGTGRALEWLRPFPAKCTMGGGAAVCTLLAYWPWIWRTPQGFSLGNLCRGKLLHLLDLGEGSLPFST